MNVSIKITAFNCNGLKNNIIYIKQLQFSYSIIFLEETWCRTKSEFTNIIGVNEYFKLYFKSTMSTNEQALAGRPYGGIGWIINKDIGNHTVIFVSDRISYIKFDKICLIGVYLTSNDNTYTSHSELELQLITLSQLFNGLTNQQLDVLIFGDFNCDTKRKNQHDKLLQLVQAVC